MARPTLVIVSGPAGSGKTTLAHELARMIGCPALCRDEIKEGAVHAIGRYEPRPGDQLTRRVFDIFFEVVATLLQAGVTVVAEAAFERGAWASKVTPLLAVADCAVVQCHTDPATAMARIAGRGERPAHADASLIKAVDGGERYYAQFDRVDLGVSIDVDTTDGYRPSIAEIADFIAASHGGSP